jgi:hypothetical protein
MAASLTGDNRPNKGQFLKNDKRINRLGRPRDFTQLRKLAQQIGSEKATKPDGTPILWDGRPITWSEVCIRTLLGDKKQVVDFLTIAYGKPPEPGVFTPEEAKRFAETVFLIIKELRPNDKQLFAQLGERLTAVTENSKNGG